MRDCKKVLVPIYLPVLNFPIKISKEITQNPYIFFKAFTVPSISRRWAFRGSCYISPPSRKTVLFSLKMSLSELAKNSVL